MLEKLQDIDRVIIKYKLQGSKGLSQVIESTIGATLLDKKLRPHKENPTVTSFFYSDWSSGFSFKRLQQYKEVGIRCRKNVAASTTTSKRYIVSKVE